MQSLKEKPVKLSPAMKKLLNDLRVNMGLKLDKRGYTFSLEGGFIVKASTVQALRNRGLLEVSGETLGFKYYELTLLGHSVNVD